MPRLSHHLGLALGLLVLAACEETTTPTPPEARADATVPAQPVTAAAAAVAFRQVSGGNRFTCAVDMDSVPYCWGDNRLGQLGVGSTTGPDGCFVNGGTFACSTRPVRVAGGHRFGHVSAGFWHACGVTADFHAWCWGQMLDGQTMAEVPTPVAVAGGLRFRQVEAGNGYTCGVTYPDNRAYCWGLNRFGGLGNGTFNPSPTPVPVLGGLRFRQVSAADAHTCGVTTTGRAFCWGYNNAGQLGDSTNVLYRTQPSAVVGGHVFRQIDVGGDFTCAVTTGDRAFCWGDGRGGAIGNGRAYLSFWPRKVAGGLSIGRVSAGGQSACAETLSNQAYCWGTNSAGQLGDGNPPVTQALEPVAVAGGHAFAQLSAGNRHVCGRTPAGVGWCWGEDILGSLGDATPGETVRPSPVRVAAPS